MKLDEIRTVLVRKKLDAYILTRNNMFTGQDILPEENRLQTLTGFTGSAGRLLIRPLGNSSILFVDGRYELQAAAEVPPDITVNCTAKGPSFTQWLQDNLPPASKIGFNPWCLTIRETEHLQTALPACRFVPFSQIEDNRLLSPETFQVFSHDIEFCGISAEEKLSQILEDMTARRLDALLITAADSVSWLTNLRSRCLPDTPVLRAYVLISAGGNISLFADNLDFSQISPQGLNVFPLSALEKELKSCRKKRLGTDTSSAPYQIKLIAEKHKIGLINTPDACARLKCVKNPVELQGMRNAHLRDGAAVTSFLCWLEQHWPETDELGVVAKLHEYRCRQQNFFSESFDTIAGFGSNGAIVHYQPRPQTNRKLSSGSLLLLDSGAQYLDGTTDTTRTIALGTPSPEQIDDYTRVLQAHIALSTAIFPEKTTGRALDALAREPLWRHGLDYAHGTGHGVGCFLNVHEGPVGISTTYSDTPLQAGMITSIEPGYYKAGHYGIRIENLVEVIPTGRKGFLAFSPLTLIPYDRRLINKSLLSPEELDWLNHYHRHVKQSLSPLLPPDERQWLEQACTPL